MRFSSIETKKPDVISFLGKASLDNISTLIFQVELRCLEILFFSDTLID